MKNIYANEIGNKIGEEISEIFVLEEIKTSQGTNSAYNSIILSDKTGKIKGVIWQTEMQEVYHSYSGTYVSVQAQVTLYNGKPILTVANLTPVEKQNIVVDDFISKMSEDTEQDLRERLEQLINAVKNSTLNVLLKGIFKEKMIECLLSKPASLKYHHAFNGGLIVHTIETAEIAKSMAECENSFSQTKLYHKKTDVDLVIAGALLHDIGKIYTLSSFPFAERTKIGFLIGHVTESIKLINGMYKKVCAINNNVDSDSMMLLEHIVRAAHEKEASPRIKEALIVRNANKSSSMMDAADTALANASADKKDIFNKYLNTSLIIKEKEKEE